MGHVTRRFRAFGDFLYALPCKPISRPPDPDRTSVRCSHTLTGSPGEGRRRGLRSSAVDRRIGFPGSSNSCASTEAPIRLPLPEGLHQGVGQEPLPAGVVAAAVVEGADDPVPPAAQRGNEGLAVLDRGGPVVQAEGEVDDGRGCPVPAAERQVTLARGPVPAVGRMGPARATGREPGRSVRAG